MIEIRNRNGTVIDAREALDLRAAVEACVRVRTSLAGAVLTGAYLTGADLTGADLRGADLTGAYLTDAVLRGADLTGAQIPWSSHDVIAELLRRAAGDHPQRRALAGTVLVSRDWCWRVWLGRVSECEADAEREAARAMAAHPEREWALETLAAYVQDGDDAPDEIRAAREARS